MVKRSVDAILLSGLPTAKHAGGEFCCNGFDGRIIVVEVEELEVSGIGLF